MRKFLLFSLFLSLCGMIYGQVPTNDDCFTSIDLGIAPTCPDSIEFTNVDATPTNIFSNMADNIPICWSSVNHDVWFEFVVPADQSIVDFTLTVSGAGANPINSLQIAVYRGDCDTDFLAELLCEQVPLGEQSAELDLQGLTPGITYFIRVDDYSANATPNWGTFNVCVDSLMVINTIDEGGSTSCSGELYDSGGPDGDYGPNENNVFTICPTDFHNCITFNLDYINIEDNSDEITFYDGPDITAPIIYSTVDDFSPTGGYGGGAVCGIYTASSGCMTIEFTSDAMVNFEGFAGSWNCSVAECFTPTVMTVDDNITDQDIINNITTPFTTVTIDTIICADGAYGTFQADGTDLGLSQGLVLTSGSALESIGPNDDFPTTTNNLSPGDDDLDFLSDFSPLSQDACVVELDVFIATEQLAFEYVFGSEEYPNFINSNFNDIFAFLISGPGIVGDPGMNNQLNIAVLPDGLNTPVQIGDVNHETNWEYFRNNTGGQSIEYNGLTSDYLGVKKSLTATANVIPCNTYHLKLAIADRGDGNYDSGVFIAELKGSTPDLSVNFASGVEYLVEECTFLQDNLVLELSEVQDDTTFYIVNIAGTATEGEDYILDIPDTIVILPGETFFSWPFIPLSDNIDEGEETIIITLSNDFGCGSVNFEELTVSIRDFPQVVIVPDTVFTCGSGINTCVEITATGASSYFWNPVSIVDDPSSDIVTVCPDNSGWLLVEGTVGPCVSYDSVWIEVIDPFVNIQALTDTVICNGSSVTLDANNNVNGQGLVWTPNINLTPDPNTETITVSPTETTTYTATISVANCVVTDQILIDVDEFEFPEIFVQDSIICQGESIVLAETIDSESTSYSWTPDVGLDDANVSGPTATPQVNTVYNLVAESNNGACAQSASINVTVIPASLDIVQDSVELCLGTSTSLTANSSTNMVTWSPDDGTLSSLTDVVVTCTPVVSQTYYGTMTVSGCTLFDSVYVQVDSLPDMTLTAIPEGPYCEGDLVTLVSPTYEPLDYPELDILWSPGAQTDPDLWNYVVAATVDTVMYTRTLSNNACSGIDTFVIAAVDTTLFLTWTDTTICSLNPLQVEVLNGTDHTWSMDYDNFSCYDCPNPEVSPAAEPGAMFEWWVEALVNECPSSALVTVNFVETDSSINLGWTDTLVCNGTELQLNAFNGVDHIWDDDTSGETYVEDNFSCIDCPNPTVVANGEPGDQFIWLVKAYFDECPTEDSVTVNIKPVDPLIIEAPDTVCVGDDIQLNVLNGMNHVWDDHFGFSCYECPNPVATPNATPGGQYTWRVTGQVENDECDSEGFITINFFDTSLDGIAVAPGGDINAGQAIELSLNVTSTSFSWFENGVAITGNTATVMATPVDNPTTYSVEYLDENGCLIEEEITLEVKIPTVDMPNIFTPNGDDINNIFRPVINKMDQTNPAVEITVFQIYNRWGKLVFDNPTQEGWNGQVDDNDAPSDVYLYKLEYKLPNGDVTLLTGDVTLIR